MRAVQHDCVGPLGLWRMAVNKYLHGTTRCVSIFFLFIRSDGGNAQTIKLTNEPKEAK